VPYLNSNLETTVEKVALNSLKEMVIFLSLIFLIIPKELLTSMMYMGLKVTPCSGIYDDDLKTSVATSIPHLLTLPNGL
jgi:hypothetical protein